MCETLQPSEVATVRPLNSWVTGPGVRRDHAGRLHRGGDVFHAGGLELADLRPHPDGAGVARAGRVPVLARACRAAGRAVVVCVASVVAVAAVAVRGVRRRRGAAMATAGAARW